MTQSPTTIFVNGRHSVFSRTGSQPFVTLVLNDVSQFVPITGTPSVVYNPPTESLTQSDLIESQTSPHFDCFLYHYNGLTRSSPYC